MYYIYHPNKSEEIRFNNSDCPFDFDDLLSDNMKTTQPTLLNY